ncbi:MAG: HAD family phosphatase [Caldilineaceae bacterium SB0664_bin_27]|uniref:HAD family phosphatase n=1 Tax=Caldilineaceae bacterium SB0664_bin_27 TaxID=2605260 RepID=A0A6B0YYE0_9CHLR|nr:HAD family phosphatase [Caldilineaceae bacterium SB0664_bin_27]
MYSVLAVDLDDTLLADDGTISPRTMAALDSWQALGRRIVVATGRPPRSAKLVHPYLNDFPMICYNGAWIELQGNVLFQATIPVDDARRIVGAIQNGAPGCRLGIEIDDTLYVNGGTAWTRAHLVSDVLAHTNRPAAKILTSLEELDAAQPLSLNGQAVVGKPSETFLRGLPETCRALISPKYDLVQVIPYGASKAAALRWLLDRWGVGMEEMISFGDDVNDVEMVAEAGLGVAMSNAVPEVKAAADRMTVTNEEDGVAVVLEEFLV